MPGLGLLTAACRVGCGGAGCCRLLDAACAALWKLAEATPRRSAGAICTARLLCASVGLPRAPHRPLFATSTPTRRAVGQLAQLHWLLDLAPSPTSLVFVEQEMRRCLSPCPRPLPGCDAQLGVATLSVWRSIAARPGWLPCALLVLLRRTPDTPNPADGDSATPAQTEAAFDLICWSVCAGTGTNGAATAMGAAGTRPHFFRGWLDAACRDVAEAAACKAPVSARHLTGRFNTLVGQSGSHMSLLRLMIVLATAVAHEPSKWLAAAINCVRVAVEDEMGTLGRPAASRRPIGGVYGGSVPGCNARVDEVAHIACAAVDAELAWLLWQVLAATPAARCTAEAVVAAVTRLARTPRQTVICGESEHRCGLTLSCSQHVHGLVLRGYEARWKLPARFSFSSGP